MTDSNRLKIIEAARALIREERDRKMEAAALTVKDLYEPGGEVTEWTALDGEEVLDDTSGR